MRPVLGLAAAPGKSGLGELEIFLGDDGRVGGLLGVDPLVCRVPAHLGHVAERDVLNV